MKVEKGLRENGRGLWGRCSAEGPQGPDFALSNVAMTAAADGSGSSSGGGLHHAKCIYA